MKIIKLLLVLAVAGVVGMAVPAYSQEAAEQLPSSISADVVSVAQENSSVVIKQVTDPVANTCEEKTISVLPETKILKEDSTALKLSDLKAGDKIAVNYTADETGKWTVKSIVVKAAN